MFAFLIALFMAFATPHHTTPKDNGSGTVTTFGDSDPDTGGETGNKPPPR